MKENMAPIVIFCESYPESYEILCIDIVSQGLCVIIVYTTPSCRTAGTDQLFKAIIDLVSCNWPCVVVGDSILPDIGWSNNVAMRSLCSVSRAFLDLCSSNSLKQHVTDCTLGNNVLNLMLSTDGLVNNVRVNPPRDSNDHKSFTFEITSFISKHLIVKKRCFKEANYDVIKDYLCAVDWFGPVLSTELRTLLPNMHNVQSVTCCLRE